MNWNHPSREILPTKNGITTFEGGQKRVAVSHLQINLRNGRLASCIKNENWTKSLKATARHTASLCDTTPECPLY